MYFSRISRGTTSRIADKALGRVPAVNVNELDVVAQSDWITDAAAIAVSIEVASFVTVCVVSGFIASFFDC